MEIVANLWDNVVTAIGLVFILSRVMSHAVRSGIR